MKLYLLDANVLITANRDYYSTNGYAHDLDETELEEVGRDPFLIAYAVVDRDNRVVVSIEASAPAKKRANRRVPDVCKDNGVSVCNTFTMLRDLGFTTAWTKPVHH
jgi:hypothetical protein